MLTKYEIYLQKDIISSFEFYTFLFLVHIKGNN